MRLALTGDVMRENRSEPFVLPDAAIEKARTTSPMNGLSSPDGAAAALLWDRLYRCFAGASAGFTELLVFCNATFVAGVDRSRATIRRNPCRPHPPERDAQGPSVGIAMSLGWEDD
jgi:hypothetical protein